MTDLLLLVLGLAVLASFATFSVIWAWMLGEVLLHEPDEGPTKLLWAYGLLLTFPAGGLAYWLFRRADRRRRYGA